MAQDFTNLREIVSDKKRRADVLKPVAVAKKKPGITHNLEAYLDPSLCLAAVAVQNKERLFQRFVKAVTKKNKNIPPDVLLDRYVERYNAGDLDGVMDLYAPDAVQIMPDGTFEGWSKVRDRLAQELDGFTDLNHVVRSFVEQGDSFADEWTFVGTHTGPFRLPDGTELPPTGKRVEIRGMELVQVRDGKMSTTDGPFVETREMLAGFVLLEARDRDEAIRIAANDPFARVGFIEVRPAVDPRKPRPTS